MTERKEALRKQELFDDWLSGRICEEDFAQLQSLLRTSAEARAELRARSAIEEGLSARASDPMLVADRDSFPMLPASKSWWQSVLPWGIAITACVVMLVSLISMRARRGESGASKFPAITSAVDPTLTSTSDPVVALLVEVSGAEFAAGRGPDRARFEAGSYEMRKGVAHIRFSNGVDVVLNAPVAFTINDPLHLRLDYGRLRVIVPPAAQGFTVLTPGVDYEDLGTEFGVTVNRNTGSSKLHVFDGQVDAKIVGPGDSRSSVLGGDSVQFANGKLQNTPAAGSDDFPAPGEIGLLRWEQQQHAMARDPTLVGYFPFVPGPKPSLLENAASNSLMPSGEIKGARWVSGRWPGKHALLFDRDSDFVQLHIPGEFQELTMAVWVKVNRLDYEMNAILNSDGSDIGDIHWQFTRQGFPRGGPFLDLKAPDNTLEFVGDPIAPGAWSHVVNVVSLPLQLQQMFVNGRLVMKRNLPPSGVIRPDSSRLGNWLIGQEGYSSPVRALRGSIDELAIWSRALPLEEIQQLVKSGRPN